MEMKTRTRGEMTEYIKPERTSQPRFNDRGRTPLTNGCKVCKQRVDISPHLMGNGRLKPGFFSRSLGEPGPDHGDVKQTQVLKQNASAKAQSLDDEVVEEIIRSFRKVRGEGAGNRGGVVDDGTNGGNQPGGNRSDQDQLDEQEGEVKGLRVHLAFTSCGRADEHSQLTAECGDDELN